MNGMVSCIFIATGFLFLTKGADLFVDNASGIAKKIGISPLVIGLTIVAFGTSLPELAVSVTAALKGSNEIAVGNVIGSNIFNLLMVGGVSAIMYPLVTSETLMLRDWPFSTWAALILCVFLLTGNHISRLEALFLLAGFAVTLFIQLKSGKVEEEEKAEEARKMSSLMVLLIMGVAGIIIGGQLAVQGATSLARLMGWSETLIGLTIVAIGTSLPELVTSVVAAKKGENEIAMGNIIGSNLFNILCILGISAFLHPITVAPTAFIDAVILTAVSTVYWLVCRKHGLGRRAGIGMVVTYIAYTAFIILR